MQSTVAGPLEFVEPDLSSLPPPQSPDPVANEKRDSISDKTRQGRYTAQVTCLQDFTINFTLRILILTIFKLYIANNYNGKKSRQKAICSASHEIL